MSTMRHWRKNDARGQSMVEMAMVLPVILILVLAAVDFAQVLSAEQRLENAAHVATLRLLTHPSLFTSTGSLTNTIQEESGLAPVSAGATYSVSGEGADQVAITATYAYTLLLPGLQNLRIGSLSNGKLPITVSAAGIAVTSAPVVTPSSGQLTVAPPGDGTAPSPLTLTCTLYQNGSKVKSGVCSSGSPLVWTSPGSNPYTATLTQINGLTSAPSAPVTWP
jgi:Flp pilus assembly protein TadG